MPAIEVSNLQKTFQTKRKAAGMGASVRALFTPQYSSVEAVRGLSFQMEAGVPEADLRQSAEAKTRAEHKREDFQ